VRPRSSPKYLEERRAAAYPRKVACDTGNRHGPCRIYALKVQACESPTGLAAPSGGVASRTVVSRAVVSRGLASARTGEAEIVAKTELSLIPAAELVSRSNVRFPNESEAYRHARNALLEEEIELRAESPPPRPRSIAEQAREQHGGRVARALPGARGFPGGDAGATAGGAPEHSLSSQIPIGEMTPGSPRGGPGVVRSDRRSQGHHPRKHDVHGSKPRGVWPLERPRGLAGDGRELRPGRGCTRVGLRPCSPRAPSVLPARRARPMTCFRVVFVGMLLPSRGRSLHRRFGPLAAGDGPARISFQLIAPSELQLTLDGKEPA
jgi:hypothetical protein